METKFLTVTSTPILLEQQFTLTTGSNYILENLSEYPIFYYTVASTDPGTLNASDVLSYGKLLAPRSSVPSPRPVTIVLTVRANFYTWIWTYKKDVSVLVSVDLE